VSAGGCVVKIAADAKRPRRGDGAADENLKPAGRPEKRSVVNDLLFAGHARRNRNSRRPRVARSARRSQTTNHRRAALTPTRAARCFCFWCRVMGEPLSGLTLIAETTMAATRSKIAGGPHTPSKCVIVDRGSEENSASSAVIRRSSPGLKQYNESLARARGHAPPDVEAAS
jgi:hypothetical protein